MGLALVGSAVTSISTLNEILVFHLSLAAGLYALTNYTGKIWALDVMVLAEALLDVNDGAARAGLDWNATRLGLLPAALATCGCAMGDGPRPLHHRI